MKKVNTKLTYIIEIKKTINEKNNVIVIDFKRLKPTLN